MTNEVRFIRYIIMFSDNYRGSKAFSEPETKAVRDFIRKQNKKQCFKVLILSRIYRFYYNM